MNSCKRILSRKITILICNFKIVELIIDMIVNSTVIKIEQCVMDKVILSSNKSQHECFKDMSTIVNVCF